MGKHNAVEPKKVSFLGAAGGLFATVLIATGLAVGTQVIKDNLGPPEPVKPNPPIAERFDPPTVEERINDLVGRPLLISTVSPSSSVVDGRNNPPGARPPASRPQNPTPNVPPSNVPPVPVPADTGVDVDVSARTPVAGVDANARVRVPLAAVTTVVEPVVKTVTKPVTDLTDKLLGK
jgi:hypothetical protein